MSIQHVMILALVVAATILRLTKLRSDWSDDLDYLSFRFARAALIIAVSTSV
jgi:hypothetical protein